MPHGNRGQAQGRGAPSRVTPIVTRQGSNTGFDELESVEYAANRETPAQLTRDQKITHLNLWVTASVTVAGVGGAPTVVERGFLDVLERLRIRGLGENLFQHSARDLFELSLAISASQPDYDDGGFDPGAAATYDLFFEIPLPFAPDFMAGGAGDFHLRARRSEDEVREALVSWANDAENAGDDQGTGVLVTGGTQTLTWDTEPTAFMVAETVPAKDDGGGPLPIATPLVETFESEVFTTAQDRLKVDFTPDAPVLALVVQAFDDGEPADLVERMEIADHPDFNNVPVEAYRLRERRLFPAVDPTFDHSLRVLLADGGLWTNRFRPGRDVKKQRIRMDVAAPSGNGRIRVMALTGHRQNVGRDVRANVRPVVDASG